MFALIARLVAVALLLTCLASLPAERHRRVAVIAVPGMELDVLLSLAVSGAVPTLASLVDTAVLGELRNPPRAGSATFWQTAFTGSLDGPPAGQAPPATVTAEQRPVWSRMGTAHAVVVAVPGAGPGVKKSVTVRPGADPATGFVGASHGRVADARDVILGELSWPYDGARKRILLAGEALDVGQWSEWLEIELQPPDRRSGAFKVHRLDRTRYYLTPIYHNLGLLHGSGRMEDLLIYVGEDPSEIIREDGVEQVVYEQIRELSSLRAAEAGRLAAGRWRLLVYFETLLVAARGLAEEVDRSRLAEAYREVDRRVAAILEAAGAGTCVLLVGHTEASTEAPAAGFYLVSDRRGVSRGSPAETLDLVPTILHLIGSRDRFGLEGNVPSVIRSRFVPLGRVATGAHAPAPAGALRPLNTGSLKAVGAL